MSSIDQLVVTHLDSMSRKLAALQKETGDYMTATANHEYHAGLDEEEATRVARTYAAAIGRLTETIEMSAYHEVAG